MLALAELEHKMGRRLGDAASPLLVSVCSGAAISMPGMMDTVLNLGMNEHVASGIAASTGDEKFAYDLYRRFIQMYGNVVLGIEGHRFSDAVNEMKRQRGVKGRSSLEAEDFRLLATRFDELILEDVGHVVPNEPHEQLQ